MSLRARLLLSILLLNLLVLMALQGTSLLAQRDQLARSTRAYASILSSALAGAESTDGDLVDEGWVRRVLAGQGLETWLSDVYVWAGNRIGAPALVELNPLGAADRARTAAELAELRHGIREALRSRGEVALGDGFCIPLETGENILAGVWFAPNVPSPTLSFLLLAGALLVSTVVFGVLGFVLIGRSVVRPLRALGGAASRIGAGDYSVRLAEEPRPRELDAVIDAFDRMTARVRSHTTELERAVADATAEAQRKERALLTSSRLAAIGTLAAGIAHEINNPIGGMLNAVQRLKRREDLDERDRKYLDLVQEGLERIARIARRVLEFSPRAVDARPFPLRAAVDAARALVEHRLRRASIELVVDLPADLPPLVGDLHEIQQVLLNLLINSLDALETVPGPRRIEIRALAENGVLRIDMRDNGPGIAAELVPRVTDPFFSKKDRPDATGLGLFICFSIVRNHGGQMEIVSDVGKGFAVSVRLPSPGSG
jgi:signal transduction histidine kinase